MGNFSRMAMTIGSPVRLTGARVARPRYENRRNARWIRRHPGPSHTPNRAASPQACALEQRPLQDIPAMAMLLIVVLAMARVLFARLFKM